MTGMGWHALALHANKVQRHEARKCLGLQDEVGAIGVRGPGQGEVLDDLRMRPSMSPSDLRYTQGGCPAGSRIYRTGQL